MIRHSMPMTVSLPRIKAQIGGSLMQAVDAILPPRCVVTGDIVDAQGMISGQAWSRLDFIARPFCGRCGFPFDFVVEDDGQAECPSCLVFPPSYRSARAALKYNEHSRDMILGFKHADKTYAAKAFRPWLLRAGKEILEQADMLVPVPLHRWRLVRRRYNQAALLAREIGRATSLPVLVEGLERIRATPSQGHLKAKERYKNVRKAFVVPQRYKTRIQGMSIVLVDDVLTTGATVQECTKALLQAGAAHVDVLTLARVVRPNFD